MRVATKILCIVSLASIASVACSSNSAQPSDDAGAPDAAAPETGTPDAAPDIPEPAWSGVTVEPGCTTNGCIRELTPITTYAKDVLSGVAVSGQVVDNGVAVFFIRYMSDGDEITGSVYVPDVDPPEGGYPVAVMNQFTSGIGAPCDPSAGYLGVGVATATSFRGILTLVPDAPSYGPPPLGVYFATRSAGRAALDGARAAFHLGPALGKSVARRAVIGGLSQGANTTMGAAAELLGYAPHLEIRGFAAVAPPANLRTSTNKVFTANAGSGFYLAMRMYTWQSYFKLGGDPVFREPYASQVEAWFEKECEFMGATGVDGTLPAHFPDDPSTTFSDAYLAMGKNDAWPSGWAAAFDEATPIPRGMTLPIVIFQGSADTTVPKVDTDAYVAQLTAAGVTVDYRVIQGSEHQTTAFGPLTIQQAASADAYAWVKDRLAP